MVDDLMGVKREGWMIHDQGLNNNLEVNESKPQTQTLQAIEQILEKW